MPATWPKSMSRMLQKPTRSGASDLMALAPTLSPTPRRVCSTRGTTICNKYSVVASFQWATKEGTLCEEQCVVCDFMFMM